LTDWQVINYYECVLGKLAGKISTRIASIALVIILVLIPSLPTLAQESDGETITITMTTKTVIEIELNPTSWEIGQVNPDTEYKTNQEKNWCTMTNRGNCMVNTYIKGDDAVWTESPSAYKWTLSNSWSNGMQEYVLAYWMYEYSSSYVLITKDESGGGAEFYSGLGIGEGNQKKFGLKLLTPPPDYTKGGIGYFSGGGEMETTITISGVAA